MEGEVEIAMGGLGVGILRWVGGKSVGESNTNEAVVHLVRVAWDPCRFQFLSPIHSHHGCCRRHHGIGVEWLGVGKRGVSSPFPQAEGVPRCLIQFQLQLKKGQTAHCGLATQETELWLTQRGLNEVE